MKNKIFTLLGLCCGVLLSAPTHIGVRNGPGGTPLPDTVAVVAGMDTYNDYHGPLMCIVEKHESATDLRTHERVLFSSEGQRITEDMSNPVALPKIGRTAYVTLMYSRNQLGEAKVYLELLPPETVNIERIPEYREGDPEPEHAPDVFVVFKDPENDQLTIKLSDFSRELPEDRETLFGEPDHVGQLLKDFEIELQNIVHCFKNEALNHSSDTLAQLTPKTNAQIFMKVKDMFSELLNTDNDPRESMARLTETINGCERIMHTENGAFMFAQSDRGIGIQVNFREQVQFNTSHETAKQRFLKNIDKALSLEVWTLDTEADGTKLGKSLVMTFAFTGGSKEILLGKIINELLPGLKIEELPPPPAAEAEAPAEAVEAAEG